MIDIKEAQYIINTLDNYTKDLSVKELYDITYWFSLGYMVDEKREDIVEYFIKDCIGKDVFDSWSKNKEHEVFMQNVRYHLLITFLRKNAQ